MVLEGPAAAASDVRVVEASLSSCCEHRWVVAATTIMTTTMRCNHRRRRERGATKGIGGLWCSSDDPYYQKDPPPSTNPHQRGCPSFPTTAASHGLLAVSVADTHHLTTPLRTSRIRRAGRDRPKTTHSKPQTESSVEDSIDRRKLLFDVAVVDRSMHNKSRFVSMEQEVRLRERCGGSCSKKAIPVHASERMPTVDDRYEPS